MNGRDRAGLEAVGARDILALPPFIDTAQWPCRTGWRIGTPVRLASVAMMRSGDKLASYGLLADALRPAYTYRLPTHASLPADIRRAIDALLAKAEAGETYE